jgi:putative aldouronate transport system permease protein
VAGIAFRLLYNDGAVNNFLGVIGRPRVPFLQDPHIFRGLVVFSDIWKKAGWSCIMYLAAIAGIDPGLYESAVIDGANRWRRIRHITWPGISAMAAVLLILAIGNMMNAGFDQIFNLYSPAVFSTSDIIDTYIYRQAFFINSDFSYSTAVGLFKGVINCAMLLSANSLVRRFGPGSIL